jgi:hypothetical protein
MRAAPPVTLPTTPEELQRLLADPTAMTPEPLRTLLRRCAVVQSFDRPLFDAILAADLPLAAESFATLTAHPLIEALPTAPQAPRRFQLAASLRPPIFAAAWIAPAASPGAPDTVTPALQSFSRQLADYYADQDDYEQLYHLIAADQAAALRRFIELFQKAELTFDLPRCHALLRIFDERGALLSGAVKEAVNRRRFRLDARTQWADEYYGTALYFERDQTSRLLGDLLRADPYWILHIFAPGGTGKTMYIRHLIARRCLRAQIPVAYVDFDYVLMPDMAVAQPWRMLVSLIDAINTQIEGRPFGELLADYARYQHPTDARDIVRVRAPQTVSQTEAERLRDELLLRFASILAETRGEKPVVFIFDTLENLRQRRLDLTATFELLRDLRARCPALRVVLSGRYNLVHGDPGEEDDQRNAFRTMFGDQQRTVLLEAFTAEEARAYLARFRQISDDELVAAILSRARSDADSAQPAADGSGDGSGDAMRINPFKLSLLADLVTYAPDITAATILEYEVADTAYLIERVVDRIEHRLVRFVLRYGVIPRYLTRDYLAAVLQPYLVAVAAGNMALDDPRGDALHAEVLRRQPFSLKEQQGAPVDIDGLWAELTSFTSEHSWVSPAGSDVVRFHPDVVAPMLRLLRKSRHPVLQQLHRDSAAYCERQAAAQPQQMSRWLSEAIYHRLAAGDHDVLAFWQTTWEPLTSPTGAAGQAIALGNETLALLAEPIADSAIDPELAARQENLRSLVAYALAFAQLAELPPSDLRRLLALATAGDPAVTQIAASDLALMRAQLDLHEGRSAAAASTARQVIVDLGDHVAIGSVTLTQRTQREATRILTAANVALGEHQQAITALRTALDGADPVERGGLLTQLAALYEQQGDWIAAADAVREVSALALARNDPLRAAAATADCVRLLLTVGEEGEAVALADATNTWLAGRGAAPDHSDYGRDLWLAGWMAAERDLAAQQPDAAQATLDRLAADEGVQRFLQNSAQAPEVAAVRGTVAPGALSLPFAGYIDAQLRARVAAACLDIESALRGYEQIAFDTAALADQPRARAAALLAASHVAGFAGDFQRAQQLLAALQSVSDDPQVMRERLLAQARLHLAAGAPEAATALLVTIDAAAATPPQRVDIAQLRVRAENGDDTAWAALIAALAQLPTPAWRLAALDRLTDIAPPAAAQAAQLSDLVRQPDGAPPQLPLGRLRLAAVHTASGNAAAAELAEVQAFAAERTLWGVLRQVYALWDRLAWPEGALVAAPLPGDGAATSPARFLAGVLWLEQGLRLVASRTFLAQGAALIERSAAVLSPQSPWFARILLGRAQVAFAHGDDGSGNQLAEGAAAAFTALGDPVSAAAARALIAATDAGNESTVVAKGLRPAGPDAAGSAPPDDSGPLPLVLEVAPVSRAAWQVTARRGAAVIDRWQAPLDADRQDALTLRSGELIGGQFVDAFAKNWLSWAAALGELVTTPALRTTLLAADPPADLSWQMPQALAWLPWEFMALRATGQPSRKLPEPFVLAPACRYAYRTAAPLRDPARGAAPPDAPVLVLRTSDVAARIAQRGYSHSADSDLLRRYQAANVRVFDVSENTLDSLAQMVREVRPRVVHIAAGLTESGRSVGLNISGDTGMSKAAPRPLGTADLVKVFDEGGVAPLLILDPPAPPGLSERVRQLCLRNAFAGELATRGACAAILATGLGDAAQQERLARNLVKSVAEQWPLLDMLRQIWMSGEATTALSALLPFVGAALFVAEPGAG